MSRDMRDPQELGRALRGWSGRGMSSIREIAEYFDSKHKNGSGIIPDYTDASSPLEKYGNPHDIPESYTNVEADGLTPKPRATQVPLSTRVVLP